MKNPTQFASNFPLTIRRLADRQRVSDAGVETGVSSAKLVGLVFNSDLLSASEPGRSLRRFPPEQVLCSLSGGPIATTGCVFMTDLRGDPDYHSGNKERVFCSLSAGVKALRPADPSGTARGQDTVLRTGNKQGHQHSENKETIGQPSPQVARQLFFVRCKLCALYGISGAQVSRVRFLAPEDNGLQEMMARKSSPTCPQKA